MKNRNLKFTLCNLMDCTLKDIHIDYNNNCGEDVVYVRGEYVGYVEDFWQIFDYSLIEGIVSE